jgi:hypothetical protein
MDVRASQLSSRIQGALPQRYAGLANPAGNLTSPVTRVPANDPRALHPKLNTSTWSASYRVKRSPSQASKRTKKMRKG